VNAGQESKEGPVPLIAYHYAGKGKVYFVGTDSTWLWRQNVGDRFFYRFWGQAVRAAARKDPSEAKKSWLEVRPARVQPGEAADIELMAFDKEGAPLTARTQKVQVVSGGAVATVEVLADPTTKGRYTGKHKVETPGEYRLTFAPGGGTEPAEAKIRVLAPAEELRFPNVNRPALKLLADTSGGAVIELKDLTALPDRLQGEVALKLRHRETSLWDNRLFLILLAFLYSLDVGLRRLAGVS
jgi:hypothetical protein